MLIDITELLQWCAPDGSVKTTGGLCTSVVDVATRLLEIGSRGESVIIGLSLQDRLY